MGAGGHAREVRDIAEEPGRDPMLTVAAFWVEPGFVPRRQNPALLHAQVRDSAPQGGRGGWYVSAVGDPDVRARLAELADAAGLDAMTLVSCLLYTSPSPRDS